jgi:hypothetical protein
MRVHPHARVFSSVQVYDCQLASLISRYFRFVNPLAARLARLATIVRGNVWRNGSLPWE